MNIQGWFPLRLTRLIFFRSKEISRVLQHHSSKASILWCSAFFIVQLSHTVVTTGKTVALTRQTFVGKVMSLLFDMLSRLVITFLPRSKHLLISWLQSPSAVILEPPQKRNLSLLPFFPHLFAMKWWDQMPWSSFFGCWVLSEKPTFSLSSFTFIKRLFSSSLLSAIRVVSSVYLRLLIFLMAVLIPACASSSPAIHMMYSIYKLPVTYRKRCRLLELEVLQLWCKPTACAASPGLLRIFLAETREARELLWTGSWCSLLWKSENQSHSVMSDSLQPHGLYSPWNSLGQNTGMVSLSLLQWMFPTSPGIEPKSPALQAGSPAEPQGKPMPYVLHSFHPEDSDLLLASKKL